MCGKRIQCYNICKGNKEIGGKSLQKKALGVKKMYKMSNQTRQMNLFEDFKFPLGELDENNRWILMSKEIPWSAIEREYALLFPSTQGKPAHDARLAYGVLLIQKKLNCSDRELVEQVKESPYLQYFVGAKEFTTKPLFGASTLVDFRKTMTVEFLAKANELILAHKNDEEQTDDSDDDTPNGSKENDEKDEKVDRIESKTDNKGTLVIDASCVCVDIAYPNDVSLLSDCREKLEKMVDELHVKGEGVKPRTRRNQARKQYLNFIKKKRKSKKEIRQAKRLQLEHVRRDLGYIDNFLALGRELSPKLMALLLTIRLIYSQQKEMYDEGKNTIKDRIVSLFQPHVRPIVRGKAKAKTEFGAKTEISVVDGFVRIHKVSWDAYNESTSFKLAVENFKQLTGHYPERVLVDQIYRNRDNLNFCKEFNIRMSGKPLGRPKKDQTVDKATIHKDHCDRNIVEGKFGEVKTTYGLERLSTKLKETSETEIYIPITMMNLARKIRVNFYHLNMLFNRLAF